MAVSSMTELWHEISSAQPAPPRALVLAVAAVALATVAYRPAWKVARNAVTIAHEGGHAVAALITGRRLSGIRLHADTSGVTVSYGKPYGFGMVLTASAGYIAPSLFGLGGAALLGLGHVTALLWVCVGLLALMLLMLRNFYGLISVLITGVVAFVVSWYAGARVQAGFAYLAVWFLLFGGVRPVFELQWQRRTGRAPNSDADQLAKLTRTPGAFWVALFVVVAVGAVLLGGHWLVPTAFQGYGK
ncbi:MAG TPA: M50 family metallopeptidase [Actinocrinis sp.]|uniref:M50 family metallopeptidase n=1 Tax=Actinocrinis sp. TaxID=1920516 RepID=UPI002DDCBDFC|nr:M50 family metallopeptidase [Actinocrinis sp.]HEV3172998.1 M50 family metallopeptidase [Actinocrinis sp.]